MLAVGSEMRRTGPLLPQAASSVSDRINSKAEAIAFNVVSMSRAWARAYTGVGSAPGRQQRIRIDRGALPPTLLGAELEDREVQVRGVVAGIAGAPYVADDVAARDRLALREPGSVGVEMGVVIGVLAARVELVDGQPAGIAGEQLLDAAVDRGQHRGAARRHDVERFVHPLGAAGVVEGVAQLRRRHALDREQQAACRNGGSGLRAGR